MAGTPPVRALFFEFPTEPELFNVSSQFLVGADILVTPVLDPNVTTVSGLSASFDSRLIFAHEIHVGIFPGRGSVIWRDWYTHEVVKATPGAPTTLAAPLGHINVHVRDGASILLHAKPAYTIEETRQGPFALLVSQSKLGLAHGTAYIDDGVSFPPGPSRTLTFIANSNEVVIKGSGVFHVSSKLESVTVLGVSKQPATITLNGRKVGNWTYDGQREELAVLGLSVDLNGGAALQWK